MGNLFLWNGLTSDDGELLTDSLVENSEVFAQPFDKKKKRSASTLRNPVFWRITIIYALISCGMLVIVLIPGTWLFVTSIFQSLAAPFFWISVVIMGHSAWRGKWQVVMGQLVGMLILLACLPIITYIIAALYYYFSYWRF